MALTGGCDLLLIGDEGRDEVLYAVRQPERSTGHLWGLGLLRFHRQSQLFTVGLRRKSSGGVTLKIPLPYTVTPPLHLHTCACAHTLPALLSSEHVTTWGHGVGGSVT